MGRHCVAAVDVRVDADAVATGRMKSFDRARRRHKGARVFGVDAALNRMAFQGDVFLFDRQRRAAGNQQLLSDDIDATDHLGDRMLYLYPGVHLNKVKRVVLEQEFEGARTPIIHVETRTHACLTDFISQCVVNAWRRRLFDDLLVSALQGAIAIAQVNGIALPVGQYLNLDVTRTLQKFLHVHHGRAESGLSL